VTYGGPAAWSSGRHSPVERRAAALARPPQGERGRKVPEVADSPPHLRGEAHGVTNLCDIDRRAHGVAAGEADS